MIRNSYFFDLLKTHGVTLFAGVPDSLLKDFNLYIEQAIGDSCVVTANEGTAISLAAGHFLATQSPALVFMQNAGQGNTVNPLVSLTDPEVYGIPVLLLVGWRGEPGTKDEPQHIKQGKITGALFEALGVPFEILPIDEVGVASALDRAFDTMKKTNAPYALIVRAGTFEKFVSRQVAVDNEIFSREEALSVVLDTAGKEDIFVVTTGKAGRELFELRNQRGESHDRDFLCVGSMGHASSIALGIALARPEVAIWCIDGDGALLMHMGALATIGRLSPRLFRHIVLNNGVHDSVGGQSTGALSIDFSAIAKACGYKFCSRAMTKNDLKAAIELTAKNKGPSFIDVHIRPGARVNLGRPTNSPQQAKDMFMNYLHKNG